MKEYITVLAYNQNVIEMMYLFIVPLFYVFWETYCFKKPLNKFCDAENGQFIDITFHTVANIL